MPSLIGAVVFALALPVPLPGQNPGATTWVQSVAFHFIDSALADNPVEALAFATPSFHKRLQKAGLRDNSDRAAAALRHQVASACAEKEPAAEGTKPFAVMTTPSVFSPDGGEAIFVFEVHRGEYVRERAIATASVVVVRLANGKWRVEGFHIRHR